MTDEIDTANDLAAERLADTIRQVRDKASTIPQGQQGECELCGNWSGRIVRGACAPCRDKWKLK